MNSGQREGLSAGQLRAYRNDGFLCPIRVLTAAQATRYRSALAQLTPHVDDPKRLSQLHLFVRWAYDLATHPAIVAKVASILGPEVLVKSTLVLNKPPRHPAWIRWHQDETKHAPEDPAQHCSAWIALTASNPQNGCMRVIPGSHRNDMLPHEPAPGEDNLGVGAEQVAIDVDESQARDLTLAPGEMSLHDRRIVHGSLPNRTDGERTGFVVRYVTPQIRTFKLPMIQVRGRNPCRHLELLRQPPSWEIEEGLRLRKDFLASRGVD